MGLHRLSGWFVDHDEKYSGVAELVVQRDVAPTQDEAAALLWPVAAAHREGRNDFGGIDIRDQPVLGVTGATGTLGGLVARRVAPYAPVLIVRNPSRAADLGLEVRSCHYADGSFVEVTDDNAAVRGYRARTVEEAPPT